MIGRFGRPTSPEKHSRIGFPVLARFEHHYGRSEQVSRIESLVREIFANLRRSVQEHTLEQRKDVLGIFGRVNRLDRLGGIGLPEHCSCAARSAGLGKAHPSPGYGRNPAARDRTRSGSRRRSVDRARIPVLYQRRQIAGMVNMRVREHDRLHVLRAHGQLTVDLSRLLSSPLIGTAIKKKSLATRCHFVHGAGHRLGRAPEGDLHTDRMA